MSNPGPASSVTQNVTGGVTYGTITMQVDFSTLGIFLTNPTIQATGSFNNYCQISNQNLSNGVNASSDIIAYPNNIANDGTGFVDIGITSSLYSQAAYSVTGPNESYLFASAPIASGTSGDLVIATDSTGTSNNIRFYTNGFNKVIANWALQIAGTTGILQPKFGIADLGKSILALGAATATTVATGVSYVYFTTSAISFTATIPAASAAIDGFIITLVSASAIATAAFVSTGATFVGAPASFAANTPVRFKYNHATLQWLPA